MIPVTANSGLEDVTTSSLLECAVSLCRLQVLHGLILQVREQISLLHRGGLDYADQCQNGSWEAEKTHFEVEVELGGEAERPEEVCVQVGNAKLPQGMPFNTFIRLIACAPIKTVLERMQRHGPEPCSRNYRHECLEHMR